MHLGNIRVGLVQSGGTAPEKRWRDERFGRCRKCTDRLFLFQLTPISLSTPSPSTRSVYSDFRDSLTLSLDANLHWRERFYLRSDTRIRLRWNFCRTSVKCPDPCDRYYNLLNPFALTTGSRTITSDRTVHDNSSPSFRRYDITG